MDVPARSGRSTTHLADGDHPDEHLPGGRGRLVSRDRRRAAVLPQPPAAASPAPCLHGRDAATGPRTVTAGSVYQVIKMIT
jgi:hypothetical protein